MEHEFPGAVPEIPVSHVDLAAAYYKDRLGFSVDWGGEDGGIAGVSKGGCRMFLTNRGFRERYGNAAPVLVWLNLSSKQEVDALHQTWAGAGARIVSPPESKPWKLHEFTVADLDGNLLRVFYDFAWETSGGSVATPQRMIDVSHTVEHGMVTYKGLPAPIICDWLSREASRTKYAPGTEFHIGKIEIVANTGTYVDSPFHRYANGKDLSELPLESLANLDCVVVRVDPKAGPAIDEIPLSASQVGGRAVLFCTGWDRHWRTDAYFDGHPHLTERAAEWLAKARPALVGIDSFNIDSVATGERPVHSVLLGSDIPIVEHMRGLAALPPSGSRFFAVPVKVKAFGTFPVRAFALV